MIARTTLILIVAAFAAGCATGKKPGPVIEKDVARVITLPDGSTCTEPAGLTETRQSPGAVQVKELFESDMKLEEALAKAKEVKATHTEVEAAYFDVCRAYSSGAVSKEQFERDRKINLQLRQQLLAQGVKAWQDKKDGIKDAGKLCLLVFGGDEHDLRNFTRLVPAEATVDDCAVFATRSGAADVLLGCTEGQWANHWAKRPVAAGPTGAKTKGLLVKDTPYGPEPNCGWN